MTDDEADDEGVDQDVRDRAAVDEQQHACFGLGLGSRLGLGLEYAAACLGRARVRARGRARVRSSMPGQLLKNSPLSYGTAYPMVVSVSRANLVGVRVRVRGLNPNPNPNPNPQP